MSGAALPRGGELAGGRDGGAARPHSRVAHVPQRHQGTPSYFALFQGTSNGGRQFLSNKLSNRNIIPLYGKSDRLFTRVFRFEERWPHLRYPGKMRSTISFLLIVFLAVFSLKPHQARGTGETPGASSYTQTRLSLPLSEAKSRVWAWFK
jgi:hypothetical protein